jgi:hypothetical protein
MKIRAHLFDIPYNIARERERQKNDTGLKLGYTDTKHEQQQQ